METSGFFWPSLSLSLSLCVCVYVYVCACCTCLCVVIEDVWMQLTPSRPVVSLQNCHLSLRRDKSASICRNSESRLVQETFNEIWRKQKPSEFLGACALSLCVVSMAMPDCSWLDRGSEVRESGLVFLSGSNSAAFHGFLFCSLS